MKCCALRLSWPTLKLRTVAPQTASLSFWVSRQPRRRLMRSCWSAWQRSCRRVFFSSCLESCRA